MGFAIFSAHVSTVLHLPRKSDARSYEVPRLSHEIILPNLTIWCSKMQTLRPPSISDEHVSCTAPATRNASFQILFKCPTPAMVFGHATMPLPAKTTSERSKVRPPVFYTFDFTRFAPQRRALFDMLTSQSGPTLQCFVRFHLGMCFPPQRRALFRHLNFQKWSEHGVLCAFWLGHVLRATTACTSSTSQLPKVVREWRALFILASTCASRHNGVHFFISHLARWLRARCFGAPTFDPPEPQIIGKTTFLPFRPTETSSLWLFLFSGLLSSSLLWSSLLWSSLVFSSLLFSSLLFTSLLFSGSSHLCFSISPHCRKFDF